MTLASGTRRTILRIDRYPENPLIRPEDVPPSRDDFEVICTFNAGVAEYNGEVILLLRVAERPITLDQDYVRVPILNCPSEKERLLAAKLAPTIDILEFRRDDPNIGLHDPRVVCFSDTVYLTSISHLRVARSKDGRRFTVDPEPAIVPDRPTEVYGIEDPRITEIDGTYYIVYKSVSRIGITQSLATTKDFASFEKQGVILPPENMDAAIFPEQVGGRYVMIQRPVPCMLGAPNMWITYSNNLIHWGDHRFLMGVQPGTWDGGRIGGGAVPIKTERGWLEIYHGATPDHKYCLGAVLLDLENPHIVLGRTPKPIMEPEAPYETHGFVPGVVFTCGAIVKGDTVHLYYGAADTVMAGADMSLREILESVEMLD
jgi:predicted GH43/DUF377 family glycosyl hydrolase